jgi:hypothetical protein
MLKRLLVDISLPERKEETLLQPLLFVLPLEVIGSVKQRLNLDMTSLSTATLNRSEDSGQKMEFIKWGELISFLEAACAYYEKSAPTVNEYLKDLYIRIDDMKAVDLREIRFVQRLKENSTWMHPNYAANQTYHLMDELGMKTTGHAGF